MLTCTIGMIHTPYRQQAGTPIQPIFSAGAQGHIEMFPEYVSGLQDVAGFARLWLLYELDRCAAAKLKVIPYLDTQPRGIFATRSPSRPNAIGLSCVRLLDVTDNILSIQDVDMLDGTPLLDIKPYVPKFDSFADSPAGWFDASLHSVTTADNRFACKNNEPAP